MTDNKEANSYFPYLALGLAAFARQKFEYPYPPTLQLALHRLSWEMLERHHREATRPTYPTSLRQTLTLFASPLRDWWPGDLAQLPPGIEAASRLLSPPLEDEAALEEQVVDYLAELDLPNTSSLNLIREELEQQLIRDLLVWAREDPQLRAADYHNVRKFLIEHPYVNEQTLIEHLKLTYYSPRKIENFYEQTDPFKAQLLYQDSYWECSNCKGLLRWTGDGRPYCVRHSCGRIDPDYQGRKAVVPGQVMRRLKTSYHLRVCLPGQAELKLYNALLELAQTHPLQVTLWPGVDRYDLRVVLPKGKNQLCWAVDVKDYATAKGLAQHIRGNPFERFDYDPTLAWDKAFYVVPHYREWLEPGYVGQLKQRLQDQLPADVSIMNDQKFLQAVKTQLKAR